MTPGQILVKESTLFDHVYLLFEGAYEYSKKGIDKVIIERPAEKLSLYGLEELKKGEKYNRYTLKALNDCLVMRVEKQNFKFLLYDYF